MTVQRIEAVCFKLFTLIDCAARNGGMWVSAGGGTANVIAGEISRAFDAPFADVMGVLDWVGEGVMPSNDGNDWYTWAEWIQPNNGGDCDAYRWDARTVARAAIRAISWPEAKKFDGPFWPWDTNEEADWYEELNRGYAQDRI